MIRRPRKHDLLRLLPNALLRTHGPRVGQTCYLSFDDGPDPKHTPRLLDLLGRHAVAASFFLIGSKIEQHPGLVQRMVDEGHAIGNHSFSHPIFTRLPLREQMIEIERTDALLARFDGRVRHSFRPPRGALPLSLLLKFARQRRSIAHWSYDSLDYQGGPVADIVMRLRERPPVTGDIVLMHDDSANAVDALETLLPEWHAQGLRFAALPETRA